MTSKSYPPETTLREIIEDGWMKDFQPIQTLQAAIKLGYELDEKELLIYWGLLQRSFLYDTNQL